MGKPSQFSCLRRSLWDLAFLCWDEPYYIDFEAMGRDMVYGGGWICLEDGHKTHVFAEG